VKRLGRSSLARFVLRCQLQASLLPYTSCAMLILIPISARPFRAVLVKGAIAFCAVTLMLHFVISRQRHIPLKICVLSGGGARLVVSWPAI